ncbi:DNA primase large subunit isoform X2 [Podarcis raffonei]|uniref:DNA primase large subunit isoform X2 n=1 Tax=Podarcis raffonei TaxID=65483 RepID=UPI002329485E|nr:DNA primase large subunit isoform X2 [Podarcis raffonei]
MPPQQRRLANRRQRAWKTHPRRRPAGRSGGPALPSSLRPSPSSRVLPATRHLLPMANTSRAAALPGLRFPPEARGAYRPEQTPSPLAPPPASALGGREQPCWPGWEIARGGGGGGGGGGETPHATRSSSPFGSGRRRIRHQQLGPGEAGEAPWPGGSPSWMCNQILMQAQADVYREKMLFTGSSRRKLLKVVADRQDQYPLSLQFYLQPPTENISLIEFESFAVDRLKLLKVVENLGVSYVKGSDDYNRKLASEIRALKFPYKALAEEDYDARRKDHISHFILRLAYCQSEELRRWFIQQEMDLFRYRFTQLSGELTKKFLENVSLSYDVLTARSLPIVQTDERLQPLLSHLSHAYVGPDYSIERNIGKISLEQIDTLSVKSFPPCMRQLHKALRDNHHLRHGGRMQYGLFLKGIGLTLEQALQFWKSEFIRGKVDADKFDKGYAYSIRHSYGKEGKRTDYTPFSCMKIIMSNPPGQGDYHGCPFRHSDPELLKQKLQSYKIPPSGIAQILELVKGMHYQLACQKYFELTHDVNDTGFSLNHPNQYFAESQQLLGGIKDIKKEQRQPENSQPKHSSQTSINKTSTSSSVNTTEEMELEGLDDYFAED